MTTEPHDAQTTRSGADEYVPVGALHTPHAQEPAEGLLASPLVRLGARMIDAIIILAGVLALAMVTAGLQQLVGADSVAAVVLAVLGYAACIVVLFGCEPFQIWRSGTTVGKHACRLRVVRQADGQRPSLGQALGRSWVVYPMAFVPFLGLVNVLWCLWDRPYRQCLHDKVVSTVVVRSRA